MSSMLAFRRPAPRSPGTTGPTAADSGARGPQLFQNVQAALFVVGAVLMPLGVVAILVGWYGTAHAKYAYDQATYLMSGGILGLGLIFLGGFLYFGAWLARVAHDQRESARQLADTLLVLADLVARQRGQGSTAAVPLSAAIVPVLAGDGTTVHRSDCALIAHRPDLHELTGTEQGLGNCRVCRPTDF